MKIRIQGNSIRLRLSQSEVKQFGTLGQVKESIQFGISPAEQITYALEIYPEQSIRAVFSDGWIKVLVPKEMGLLWAGSNVVGMEEEQILAEGKQLKILVEKDFKCLTDREGEDERDLFPNPGQHDC